jgi:glucokinase
MYIIGIDIGATNTRFVLLNNSKILKTRKIFTPKTKKEIIKVLEKNIREIAGERFSRISGIGIGVPGPINRKRDLILNPPNLSGFKNCPLSKIIEKDLKIKIKIENEVNCFTLAEARIGAGKMIEIVVGITLGSGLGGGLVIKEKIYQGAFGSAGEFGHMSIEFDGLKCSCGCLGCWEEYASQKYLERKSKFSGQELNKLAKEGDRFAKKIWKDFGRNLGIGISNIINILDPEMIVLGGGISQAHKFFMKSARKEIQKRVLSPISKKNVKIKITRYKGFAGAIGAALLFNQ